MIRSFIAFELEDKKVIERISYFSSRLRKNQPRISLVKPTNLHLTVKFLGNIKESLAPKVYKILQDDINSKMFKGKTFEYNLAGVGQFNNFAVIWIKLNGNISFLQKIKSSIENALNNELKIERDRRMEFKPHLTIGRLKKQRIDYKTFDSFKNLMAENKNLEFGSFKISQIKLKKSELTPRGPIYSDLEF